MQKSEFMGDARLNMAQSNFSLIRAKFTNHKDPEVCSLVSDLQKDIDDCRVKFQIALSDGIVDPEEETAMNRILDGIEYRIDEVIVKTKIIDTASLQEMVLD